MHLTSFVFPIIILLAANVMVGVVHAQSSSAETRSLLCPQIERTLSQGVRGPDVISLQRFLRSVDTDMPADAVTGYFGRLTRAAVSRYQIRSGILASNAQTFDGLGAIGPRTRRALRECYNLTLTSVALPTSREVLTLAPLQLGREPAQTVTSPTTGSVPVKVSTTVTWAATAAASSPATGSATVIQTATTNVTAQTPRTTALSCVLNGITIANGTSVDAFEASFATATRGCQKQERRCNNGTLSGNYSFAACVAREQPPQCTFAGAVVPDGTSVTAFRHAEVE